MRALLLAIGLARAGAAEGLGAGGFPPPATPPGPVASAGDATLTYYNARLALREGRPAEALKLWWARNAIVSRSGEVSAHDDDFRSVTWAAVSALGLCADGYRADRHGAGLWPLALHNAVLRAMNPRPPAPRPAPFQAFTVGRQARFVTLGDVLSLDELDTVTLQRGRCLRPRLALIGAGELPTAKLSDRQVAGRVLRHLLVRASETLAAARVRGRSVLQARIFDLDLQLAELAAREARADARAAGRTARALGLAQASADAMRAAAPTTTLDPASPAAGVLRACAGWPVREWMALSPDRRAFLFVRARTDASALPMGARDPSGSANQADPEAFTRVGLGVIDALVAEGEGAEAERWIGLVAGAEAPAERQRAVWAGARGAALLTLDPASGFRERAAIALHRGVDELATGDLHGALRSFALARAYAPESRAAAELDGLTLRWLAYVAAQFEVTDTLLSTLRELTSARDYARLLEGLMWSAAFHADARSFEAGLRNDAGRGALERRIALLRPLTSGDVRAFGAGLDAALAASPGETLRVILQLLERLETEDADVRAAQLPTLRALRARIAPLTTTGAPAGTGGGGNREGRLAGDLLARVQSLTEGVEGVPVGAPTQDLARALDPTREVYAGSVRLAPSDPVPWPFVATEPQAPPVFEPIELRPVEWIDARGARVFGWSIRG